MKHEIFGTSAALVVVTLAGCGTDRAPQTPSRSTNTSPEAGSDEHRPRAATGTRLELSVGPVQGKVEGSTREFLGIPFGKPPEGELRFAAPEPATAWTDVRDATQFGTSCPQPTGSSIKGPIGEDCLNLNVYTPTGVGAAPLPVMVFVYGGGFNAGSSNAYDGRALSEVGSVVVVTLNYRVNAFGFLSHPALDAVRGDSSGSDGIRDQQLALRWIHDHIADFNGDPTNVTLFGQSAGSRSVCIHMAAPESKGLAARFILESGACYSGGPLGLTSKGEADALGKQLVSDLCPDKTQTTDIAACLRQQPIEALANWNSDFSVVGAGWDAVAGDGPEGVLPETVDALFAAPDYEPPPVVVGTNENEWATFQLLGTPRVSTAAEFTAALDTRFGDHAADVAAHYRLESDAVANEVFVRLITDVTWRCPTRALVRQLGDRGGDVHLYSFEQGRAIHGQELDYVFGSSTLAGVDPISKPLADIVQGYWTWFARTGDPNSDELDAPGWAPYRTTNESYVVLADPPKPPTTPFPNVCDFWDDFARSGGTVTALFRR